MEREMLNFVLQDNHYIEGGTKEACIKVRDFLHYAQLSGNKIISTNTCVSAEEFEEAVKTLMAAAFQQDDTIPERWYCDNDCRYTSYILCPGECNIRKNSDKLCPHYSGEEW